MTFCFTIMQLIYVLYYYFVIFNYDRNLFQTIIDVNFLESKSNYPNYIFQNSNKHGLRLQYCNAPHL